MLVLEDKVDFTNVLLKGTSFIAVLEATARALGTMFSCEIGCLLSSFEFLEESLCFKLYW